MSASGIVPLAKGWAAMFLRTVSFRHIGLAFGLLLTVAGLLIVLLLPGRPGSLWKLEGPLPKRGSHKQLR